MFSLTKDTIEYIHAQRKGNNEKPVIIIYQISKQACAGSYLDYYLELNFGKANFETKLYEKYEFIDEVDDGYGNTVLIYIEKRILVDFPETGNILIDIQKTKKFEDEFISLILKEGKK